MTEQWKAIPGYEGRYEVSDRGRVRSYVKYKTGRVLRPGIASNGYPTVALNGCTRTVHSLVAETFIGPRPDGHTVCHKNGDRTDARLKNIRYGTYKQNAADKIRHGTVCRGTAYASAKLTDRAAREIRKLKGKVPQSVLAERYNVSPAAVQAVHDGRTWKHV